MDWRAVPKVELHLHLDCSLSYDVVSRIEPSITRDEYQRRFVAPPKCADLTDYLTRAPSSFPLMQTEDQLRLVVQDLFGQLRKDGLLYAEIRFAPLLHTEGGLSPQGVVAAVDEAFAEGIHETGVEARIILCTLRYFSEEQSLETVRLVEEFRGTNVVGFDIAADKPGDVFADHISAFQYARDQGIPFTAHAGETRGLENVRETVHRFAPSRLGHGVCSIRDPELLNLLRERHIHLEACPTCNVQTDCYATYADHPIDPLYRAGISIGVNTDTRAISNITLSQEYAKLHQTFGWQAKDFLRCNQYALEAAFISDDVRAPLRPRLTNGYQLD